MVDYRFYTDCYLGSRIPEKAFPVAAARAGEYLNYLSRVCRVVSAGEETRKMALCAMAEKLYERHKRSGIRSAGVGGVTVSYREEPEESLLGQMLRCAGIYLDIYRGVDG